MNDQGPRPMTLERGRKSSLIGGHWSGGIPCPLVAGVSWAGTTARPGAVPKSPPLAGRSVPGPSAHRTGRGPGKSVLFNYSTHAAHGGYFHRGILAASKLVLERLCLPPT